MANALSASILQSARVVPTLLERFQLVAPGIAGGANAIRDGFWGDPVVSPQEMADALDAVSAEGPISWSMFVAHAGLIAFQQIMFPAQPIRSAPAGFSSVPNFKPGQEGQAPAFMAAMGTVGQKWAELGAAYAALNALSATALDGSVTITDTQGPTATVTTSTTPSGCTVTVTYVDNLAVDVATISTGNLAVTGPAGSLSNSDIAVGTGDPKHVPVLYTIDAPGGAWLPEHNGTYAVTVSGVKDAAGNVMAPASATFDVGV